ncbi:hypothetical protein SPBR_05939 [Sporothrix brasiliensis 5110]|uniref:Uncharacterized protein n=1 Tax=Sporothrix brasiliensis 5110 TaxID=1398154 RepID=A0A0C2IXR7_9PEZI|nr:uncharacterized protein SPBR_05939 [Sporothrix brasiliensis 5110]KIH93926.1 hypothetical protein SPBR_05939 [Sporothrix brasiliensis 5110]
MDPQVTQLHIAIHERLQRQRAAQRGRRTIAGVSVPWPKRWAGSLQWRQNQAARQQLWESSFDGTTGTLGATGGLASGLTTSITQQLCPDLSATHQISLTANIGGNVGGTTAPAAVVPAVPPAASTAANKNAKANKLLGDATDIPQRWKWFLSPRETILEWAMAKARSEKRMERKRTKKDKAAQRKALKALKEQEAKVAQKSVSVDVYGPGVATGEEVPLDGDDAVRTAEQQLEAQARARAAATLGPRPPGTEAELAVEAEAFAAAAVAPRVVTQYGRVWVRPKNMYGEEGSVAATGDGAASNVDNDNIDDASSYYENGLGVAASPPPCCACGVSAPPNSVVDSGYGHMEAPVIFDEEDEEDWPSSLIQLVSLSLTSGTGLPPHATESGSQAATATVRCSCRSGPPTTGAISEVDGATEVPALYRRRSWARYESSFDDGRSFVTCLSRL